MVEEMNNKVAFCVVSTNNRYVYKAIITLLSVKENNKEHKEFEYFVCGNFSNKYKNAIERYNLKVLNMNLGNIFKHAKSYSYPQESFWICAVPEMLYRQGFKYSITLDGDVFCMREVPIAILKEIKDLGLMQTGKLKTKEGYFGTLKQYEVMKKFNLENKDFEKFYMNSGVMISNNESLTKKKFKDKFIEFYKNLYTVTSFQTDEIIFFLLDIKNIFNFHYIGKEWNYYYKENISEENKIIFAHLLYKPWHFKFLYPERKLYLNCIGIYERRRIKYAKLYINFAKNTYKYKFYLYYLWDLIPIKSLVKRTIVFSAFSRLRKSLKKISS